ncbi:MAG: outer membrane protein transport protein [Dysgonamonadaceae bacterium]
MKKCTFLLLFALLFSFHSFGQGEVEANMISRGDLYGTARGLAMGGAFGALGGDQTGVAINPAGIAVYRSSEIAGTLTTSRETSKIGNGSFSVSDSGMNNLGYIGYFPLRSNNVPSINFGFTYNKLKSFEKSYSAAGGGRSSSLTDYIVHRHGDVSEFLLGTTDVNGKEQDPFYLDQGAPWLPILAYQSFLMYPIYDNTDKQIGYESILNPGDKVENLLDIKEKGSIENFDFSIGTSINNRLNFGFSLNVTNIYYNLSSIYTENFPTGDNNGFDVENWLTTEGAGVGLKLGAIYRPTNSIRLGLAYHSPVWYTLTDTYSALSSYKIDGYLDKLSSADQEAYLDINNRTVDTGTARWDYNFKTPGKWIASIAGVFGSRFIASLDYEVTNYKDMSYSDSYGSGVSNIYNNTNSYIDTDYKSSSTVRAGVEYRFTPRFYGRLGYAWMENPYNEVYKDQQGDAMISGTVPHYRMEGDANYYTGGIGYRFNQNVYMDLAVVFKNQTDDLYPYPNVFADEARKDIVVDAEPYVLENNNVKAALTIGYKF